MGRGKTRQRARRRLAAQFGEVCMKCGTSDDLGIDMIRPGDLGGCNWLINLQILCRPCNREKGKETIDYRPDVPWLDQARSQHAWGCQKHGGIGIGKRQRLIQLYGRVCLRCKTVKDLTLDHVVPKSKGGSNHISNLQLLCRPCNQRKGSSIKDYRPFVLAASLEA